MAAWSGLDQRNFPRIEAKCDIRILEHAGKTIHTKTKNIGGGGVRVLLAEALERFSHVTLAITLPDTARMVRSAGRVVWTVKSTNPATQKTTFDTGIEFMELKPEDKETILILVRQAASPFGTSSHGNRFLV